MAPFGMPKGEGGGAPKRQLPVEVLLTAVGARAFEALRQPLTPGALPATFVASKFRMHRDTVASAAQSQMPRGSAWNQKAPGRPTPFDNVMAHAFDWNHNGGRGQMELLLGQLHQFAHSSPEDAPKAGRFFLGVATQIALQPANPFLTQFTVNSAAMDFLRRGEETLPYALDEREQKHRQQSEVWARWLLDKRIEEFARTGEAFVALLGVTLRVIGRRPKAGYTTAEIVNAMQALWSGMIFRMLMDPSSIEVLQPGEGPVERAMWDLMTGMTEVGVLLPTQSSESETDVDHLLEEFQTSEASSRALCANEALARTCVDHLIGRWSGETSSAVFRSEFASASLPIAEALLVWIRSIALNYPGLLEAARFDTTDPTYVEVFDLVTATIQLAITALDPEGARSTEVEARRRARSLLLTAIAGGDLDSALRQTIPSVHPE